MGNQAKSVVAGVLDFTAEPGQVMIPIWMRQHLGLGNGHQVLIRLIDDLPAGEAVSLQPLDARFLKLSNHQAASQ
jgi:bifunctional DNA-binding transcriptional regulator/antitoxin component of YhaV-PrlF toxin-antitoxin module